MAEHIVPLLEKYKVTMQFSGHFHAYVRSQQSKSDGTYYIISGGGGGSLNDVSRIGSRRKEAEQVEFSKSIHHFCVIEINGDHLAFSAVDVNGNVFDSLKINK